MKSLKLQLTLCLLLSISVTSQSQPDSIEVALKAMVTTVSSNDTEDDWKSFSRQLNKITATAIASQKNKAVLDHVEPLLNEYNSQLKAYKPSFADINYYVGLAHTNEGSYISALPYCEISEQLTKKCFTEDTIKLMKRKIILSHLYASTDQIMKAIKVNEEGLILAKEIKDPMMMFRFLMNGGNAFQYKGEYSSAISYFNQAHVLIKGKNPLFEQAVKTNIGAAYLSSEQPKKAKIAFLEALELSRQGSGPATGEVYDQLSTVILLNDLSKVYTQLGQLDSAMLYATKTMEGINRIYTDKHAYHGEFLLNLGLVQKENGNIESAVKTLTESIELNNQFRSNHNSYSAIALMHLGDIESENKNFERAMTYYQESIAATVPDYNWSDLADLPSPENRATNPRDAIESLSKMGTTYKKWYALSDSLQLLEQAVNVYTVLFSYIDGFKAQLTDVESRLLFSSNFKDIYSQAIDVTHKLYQSSRDKKYIEIALRWMEKNKANELFIALNMSQLKETSQDSIFRYESEVKSKISYLEKRLTSISDSAQKATLQSRLYAFENDLRNVVVSIEKKYPQFYDIKYNVKQPSIDDLQKQLNKETVLVSYFVGTDQAYFVTIDKSSINFGTIGSASNLKNEINSLIKNLKAGALSSKEQLNQVFEMLQPSLKTNYKQLLIIPDDILSYLPFEVITHEGKHLLEYTTITYSPSVNFLHFQRQTNSNSLASIYAPSFVQTTEGLVSFTRGSNLDSLAPLPYAEEEANSIAQLFDSNALTGKAATETHFKTSTKKSAILHLATHAVIDEQSPEFSKLLLNNDSLNDGLLHTYELYNMQLNADLVALSACNTGVGKYYSGEGVMSLARGFMYAGVPNVMMSLWSVPDKSTSEIMQSFYSHLKNGLSKPEALRQAKLDYLAKADENTSNPYYWAGFVYIGNPESDKGNSNLWIGIVAAFIVSAIVIGIRQKRRSQKA